MKQEEKDINFSTFRGRLVKKTILKGNEKKYAYLTVACILSYSNENIKISINDWKIPYKKISNLNKIAFIIITKDKNIL